MSKTIVLEVTHPDKSPGRIEGFRFLWAYYVAGHDMEKHCQACLKGKRVAGFHSRNATSGRKVHLDLLDEFSYVHVCGAASGPKQERGVRNVHFPLKYAEGEVALLPPTYNGYIFRAENAVRVDIPEPRTDLIGKTEEHVRCKIFRFAVGAFGHPAGPPTNSNET